MGNLSQNCLKGTLPNTLGYPMIIGMYLENYRAGGLDRVVIDLVNHWPNSTDCFVLFCNDNHEGLPNLKNSMRGDVTFVSYPAPAYMRRHHARGRHFFALLRRFIYYGFGCYFALLWEVPHLCRLFKRYRLHVIMIHNGGWPAARSTRSAAVAGWMIKLKQILLVIHGVPRKHHPAIQWQEHCLEYLLSRMKVAVITISRASSQALHQFTWLPSAGVIYDGIRDTSLEVGPADRADIRSTLGLNDNTFLIGMFGTLEHYRGHALIIDAMNRLLQEIPEGVLLIAGTGTTHEQAAIEEMIGAAGLNGQVRLLGYRHDVPWIMRSLDVVINPVQSYLVAVEAMALGRPVVAARVGAIPELIDDGITGFLVPPDNPEVFAQRLICLYRDRELRRRMGEAGHLQYQTRFQAGRMAQEYYKLLS